MNRAIAVAATLAAAATATFALATGITPAQAAVRPRPAVAHTRTALPRTLHRVIAGAFGSGTDVTIVRCTRVPGTPLPPHITPDAVRADRHRRPGTAFAALLNRPPGIKATYTCTVIVAAKPPVTARKKTHPGRKGCGFGTAEGARGGSGKEIGCSRVINLGPGSAAAALAMAGGRALG